MATKSKLELAVDAGKWEDGLRKAQNSMKAFEQSIGGLEKATSSEKEKMAQFIQILGNTKSTAATASQQVKEYRSTIERLQVISTKLNDEQKKLADDAMAKLTKRMQEAKGQVDQLNLSMNETSDKGNSTGNVIDQLAGKFGLSTKELLSFGSALAIGKTALDTMKGAMESNEATHDAYARTVEVCDAVTNQFLLDLANADFSNFISGLQSVIDKAIYAYNALDEFESYAARFNPAQQAQEAKIQTLMQQARAAKAQGDNARAEQLNNEAKALINQLEQTTKEYGQKQTTSGYATIRSKMGEVNITDQQIAWYADPKNWDKAQQKAKEYQRIQAEINRDNATLNTNLGVGKTAERMYKEASDRLKANQQALRNDPSLKRAYTFQNLRDSGEEGAAFRQALSNIYGNTMAESRIESLRARADRMDGVITHTNKPKTPTATKPEEIIPEGSIAEAEKRLSELQKAWKEATTQEGRNDLSRQIAEANEQLDIMKGKLKTLKPNEQGTFTIQVNAEQLEQLKANLPKDATITETVNIEPGNINVPELPKEGEVTSIVNIEPGKIDIPELPKEGEVTSVVNIEPGKIDIPELPKEGEITSVVNIEPGNINVPELPKDENVTYTVNIIADTNDAMKAVNDLTRDIEGRTLTIGIKVPDVQTPGAVDHMSMSNKSINEQITKVKTEIDIAEPDSTQMESLKAKLKDLTTLKATLDMSELYDIDTTQYRGMLDAIHLGLDIEDDTWQSIVDNINEQLASLNLPPIELNVKTGGLEGVSDNAKQTASAWQAATRAISSAGSAMTNLEDPSAKVAGIVMQAIANVALGFAQASASPATGAAGVFGWIAAATAGVATMTATIAQIKSATEYHADGGMVGMSPFIPKGTDTVPAMLTPGEIVLNAAQQRNMADNLQGTSNIVMQSSGESRISGEDLVTVINAYGRRTGRGEILK